MPRAKSERVVKKCANCGVEFSVKIRDFGRKYCSFKCAQKTTRPLPPKKKQQ